MDSQGMSMFSEETNKLILLVSQYGWSMHTQYVIDDFLSEDPMDLFATITTPSILMNRELRVYNAWGDLPFIWIIKKAIEEKDQKFINAAEAISLAVLVLSNLEDAQSRLIDFAKKKFSEPGAFISRMEKNAERYDFGSMEEVLSAFLLKHEIIDELKQMQTAISEFENCPAISYIIGNLISSAEQAVAFS
jgi:hypothetical protein